MKRILKIENVWILIAIGSIIHNYWYGIHKDYYITQLGITIFYVMMCVLAYVFTKFLEE